jgi:hypothetical protein
MSAKFRPTARVARIGFLTAPMVGLALAVLLVWQSSYSAFTATTSNGPNNWAAGSVVLSDNDSNIAMFTATKLKPGDTGTKCITVTSTGTVPSTVKLYGTGLATTNGLSGYLDLDIDYGVGANANCTDFSKAGDLYLGTLASIATSYGTGYDNWAPTGTGTETRTYKIVYTVNAGAPNSTQLGTAAATFTWEAQS